MKENIFLRNGLPGGRIHAKHYISKVYSVKRTLRPVCIFTGLHAILRKSQCLLPNHHNSREIPGRQVTADVRHAHVRESPAIEKGDLL